MNEAARPIVSLYRQILRAHYKCLPPPMRVLGDGYAREEFRRHLDSKSMTNDRWIEFASEWSRYLANVAPKGTEGAGPKFTGELSKETIDAMSEEKRMMLRKLKEEAQSFGESVKADEETK